MNHRATIAVKSWEGKAIAPNCHPLAYLRVFLIITIICPLLSCQTVTADKDSNDAAVLATQKTIVFNDLDAGDPRRALKDLGDIIYKHPNDPDIQSLMGLTQLALKNPRRAVSYLANAYRLRPDVAGALNLSSGYLEEGAYRQAKALLVKVLKQKEATTYRYRERLFHNLGLAAERTGQYHAAERFYLRAVEENPTYYQSLIELGQLYTKTKRPAKARARFEAAMQYCRSCFEPVDALAMNYVNSGHADDAERLLTTFTKQPDLNPSERQRAVDLLRLVRRAEAVSRRRAG